MTETTNQLMLMAEKISPTKTKTLGEMTNNGREKQYAMCGQ